jgi:hypothetical protein
MRRIVIVVTLMCALALATGVAGPASPVAPASDTPSVLLADPTTDDGKAMVVFLVMVVATAVLAQGARIVCRVPPVPWVAGYDAVFPRLARAPPREQVIVCASLRPAGA